MNGAQSRTRVARDHALITPESHVPASIPGWTEARAITIFAPVMGAGFVQSLVTMSAGATSAVPLPGVERFLFVLEGSLRFEAEARTTTLEGGGYAFVPAGTPHTITSATGATFFMLEKRYVPLAGASARLIVSREQDVPAVPFLGDPSALLRTLLPDEPGFDMAMNTFVFQPGASLPMVESHVMEHGLVFLEGGGVYRLGDAWYPVQAGDAIWMAPYLPQWFGCIGKGPARYLYYKDVNRDPMLEPRR
ncbi:(S)-ureidoglycine aminohydrolase [Sandaracinus amylolyticus]|uniref:Ureidoglycine aminohydrolase n=1 Tax=Sandaracinus amylolyticus TaxID=927083 RepID=A0A0F6W7Q5_9BACT|nr:(S)-ureidoglycine aminohydrolase [Sandaracinus amylolyticus]AKF09415.1 Ureidoglycine aminohydrolase [Sandaracinus amylolyticus]